jgi:hypothetical protein
MSDTADEPTSEPQSEQATARAERARAEETRRSIAAGEKAAFQLKLDAEQKRLDAEDRPAAACSYAEMCELLRQKYGARRPPFHLLLQAARMRGGSSFAEFKRLLADW